MQELERKKELITYLTSFISENRKQRFDDVISQRTDHMRIVLEDVYQAHNASAVLRSCDCFGIQHVHFIENRNKYKVSQDVAMGAGDWLTLHRHTGEENNTVTCLTTLKQQGYKIIATTPHTNDCTLSELPIDDKFALVFGTEIDGVSQHVMEHADAFVKIPMYGFTESFNISVCAALCMYELTTRIRKSNINIGLTEEEQVDVYLNWLKSSIKKSDLIINEYENRASS